ncbi:MAG: DUF2235 domain-containing protein [Terriglobales bacterium]
MPKNIVVCCDGTANEFAEDRTNVVKLYYTLEQDPKKQIVYYHPGLGTMEPAGALSTFTRKFTRMLGMAVGFGLASDVRDAYVFLMDHFETGDQVFLFGFSRGAYTARAVCSLLHMYGLIPASNAPLVPYAIRMMMAIEKFQGEGKSQKKMKKQQEAFNNYQKLAGDFKTMMCRRDCNPHFVGVWDTVSSIGWKNNPLKLPYIADNPDIAIGRHAIAIDERRAFFRSHRWIPSKQMQEHGPKDVLQVWFPGVHCDVGGGYPEGGSGLSKIALEWMLEQAKMAGLCVNPQRQTEVLGQTPNSTYAKPDADACVHESLKGWWKLAEWMRKPHYDFATGKTKMRRNRGRARTIPPGSLIHESTYTRQQGAYAEKLPKNATMVKTQYAPQGQPCGSPAIPKP